MSVQQKLIECEKSMPIDQMEGQIDAKINSLLDSITNMGNQLKQNMPMIKQLPMTPSPSINSTISLKDSFDSNKSSNASERNESANNTMSNANFARAVNNIEALTTR
jgi:hypothetical protein